MKPNTDTQKQGRSLPWFRVDNDSVDHPKVDALAERLNEPLALAYVIRLWAWTMRYSPSGRLAGGAGTARAGRADGARVSVERACGWRGEPGELWNALVETGWIDVADDGAAEVHDWDAHQGAAVAKAEKDAERKRTSRSGAETARGRRADGAGQSTEPRADGAGNETKRDETERDSSKEEEPPPSSKGKSPIQFDLAPPDATKTLESWTREDFWRWAECKRRKAGLPQERWPNSIKLRDWWQEARPAAEIAVLQETYLRFAEQPKWQQATPPLPFNAFMSLWNQYLPRGAPNAS